MSWRRTIRPATDRVAQYSGLLWVYERRMRSKITILMYHRVLEDSDCAGYPFPSLVMPRSLFEDQVDWLARYARVLPLSDALSHSEGGGRTSKPVVCLTFDDGYVDNLEIAAPTLEDKGLRGTFFITAGAVEARKPLWYDRAAALWTSLGCEQILQQARASGDLDIPGFETRKAWIQWLKVLANDRRETVIAMLDAKDRDQVSPCALMTADQVRQLASAGHEIGSHTLWHPILPTMAEDARRNEIEGARRLLQEWTKREVPGFCYPNGDFDADVVRQLQEAGHAYACTTQPGSNDAGRDRFELRRIDMTRDRVVAADGRFDSLGFRAEISLLREGLRRR